MTCRAQLIKRDGSLAPCKRPESPDCRGFCQRHWVTVASIIAGDFKDALSRTAKLASDARMASTTPEQRRAIGVKAAQARWGKREVTP